MKRERDEKGLGEQVQRLFFSGLPALSKNLTSIIWCLGPLNSSVFRLRGYSFVGCLILKTEIGVLDFTEFTKLQEFNENRREQVFRKVEG